MLAQVLLLSLSVFGLALGHGSLQLPQPRDIVQNVGVQNRAMDAPVPGGQAGQDFICRGLAAGASQATLTAGQPVTLVTNLQARAPHVGDCAVYLNLNSGGDGAAPPTTGWFKIASLPDCRSSDTHAVVIPEWVKPSTSAILRWEWYALHVFPNAEFYAQCVDVVIENPNTPMQSDPDATFSIPGNLPPPSADNYRNPFGPQAVPPFTVTGPPVARAANANGGGGPGATTTPANTATIAAVGNANSAPPVPCTANSDCASGVCEISGTCYRGAESSGIGPGGAAAVAFALLFLVAAGILVALLIFRKDEILHPHRASYHQPERFEDLE